MATFVIYSKSRARVTLKIRIRGGFLTDLVAEFKGLLRTSLSGKLHFGNTPTGKLVDCSKSEFLFMI